MNEQMRTRRAPRAALHLPWLAAMLLVLAAPAGSHFKNPESFHDESPARTVPITCA